MYSEEVRLLGYIKGEELFPSLKCFAMSLYALLTLENMSDGRYVLVLSPGVCSEEVRPR